MAVAALFLAVCTWTSYARWANFEYRTFDLAYYVQAIWQLIHGRFQVSVEPVPLLGNHVEPIICFFAPLFFLFRHPMLFIVVQNAALASMGPLGYDIAKRLGFDGKQSCLLGALLLISDDAAALAAFYREALGFPLEDELHDGILLHYGCEIGVALTINVRADSAAQFQKSI